MKSILNILLVSAASLVAGTSASAVTESFDDLKPGPLPSSWEGSIYGPRADKPGIKWPVVAIAEPGKQNVLKLDSVTLFDNFSCGGTFAPSR